MDDSDVCPLCCEELDLSDRQFFPCKCGYQVCMWCWHRIRESESGLCPACRTPYGDDPHEFSAVDMEEIVKANKEKAAAEKREKERLRQLNANSASGGGSASNAAGNNSGFGSGGASTASFGGSDGDLSVGGTSRGNLDPPKDRNQLANMRVIRRNLVYAVGLPPSIATEDTLRKPEYFGQYGKIAKIVLNRNHNGNGDPRRASASAYVTFVHKEDTLACILALDGFYLDGRNIRASYGTSKYCSAFIKNVRCNNPDCTYLHCMGDSEDTFTKQEIQAGYVTSGRDVLARQQQLLAAAAASAGGSNSRRRVGSGGPSGTGKASASPIFPPPTYEEPNKSTQVSLVPPPPSTSSTTQFPPVGSVNISRATTVSTGMTGFSAVAAGKAVRSSSVPNVATGIPMTTTSSSNSDMNQVPTTTTAASADSTLTSAEMLSRQQEQLRKLHPQNNTATAPQPKSTATNNGTGIESSTTNQNATIAAVVAGSYNPRSGSTTQPPPSLAALTPLKRSQSLPEKKVEPSLSTSNHTISTDITSSATIPTSETANSLEQTTTTQRDSNSTHNNGFTSTTNNDSSPSSPIALNKNNKSPGNSHGAIGGNVIGGTIIGSHQTLSNVSAPATGSLIGSSNYSAFGTGNGIGIIGGIGSDGKGVTMAKGSFGPSDIGGPSFLNGQNGDTNNTIGGGLIPSSQQSQWGGGNNKDFSSVFGSGNLLGSNNGLGGFGSSGIWAGENQQRSQGNNNNFHNNGVIGSKNNGDFGNGVDLSKQNLFQSDRSSNSGSSTLASMLGIELPTGVGSLRDSLWASSTPVRPPPSVSGKSGSSNPTPIGSGMNKAFGDVIIGGNNVQPSGGLPIGGYGSSIGGGGFGSGNSSDVALLQSLLPGVHITSGNAYQPAAPNSSTFGQSGWGSLPNASQPTNRGNQTPMDNNARMKQQQLQNQQQQQQLDTWGNGGFYSSGFGSQSSNNNQKQSQSSNIW